MIFFEELSYSVIPSQGRDDIKQKSEDLYLIYNKVGLHFFLYTILVLTDIFGIRMDTDYRADVIFEHESHEFHSKFAENIRVERNSCSKITSVC